MPMKRYLMIVLLVSGTALLGLVGIAEVLVRESPTPYSAKFELLKSSDYSVLILGSSHTYFGVDPTYFLVPAINEANVSQDFKYDLHILQKALSFNKNISHVVLPVSMFSLTSDLVNGSESWRRFNYSLYMGYHRDNVLDSFDIRNYSVFIASPNRLGLLKRSVTALAKKKQEIDWSSKGWGNQYYSSGSMETLLSTGKSAAARHQKNIKLSEVSLQSLHEIAALCELNRIHLILLTPPTHISYRQNINASRLTEIASEVKKLQTSYASISYLNYFDDQRFTASDFHDADHLSHQGAEKLSGLISREIDLRN